MEKILLITSLVLTTAYLIFIKNKYGSLPSISKSAQYLTRDGINILFFLFIGQLCLVMGWVGQSYFSTASMMLLVGIGVLTGYNPKIPVDKMENTLHVILTTSAIVSIVADIIYKGIVSKDVDTLLTSISCVLCFALPSYFLWKKKARNYTYWIEVICLAIVYGFYFLTF